MPAARVADHMKALQSSHTEIHVSEAGTNSTRPYTEKPDISEDAIVNIRTYRRPAFLEKRQQSYRDLGDESPDLRRPSDVKQKQARHISLHVSFVADKYRTSRDDSLYG